MSLIGDIKMYGRFASGLRGYLKEILTFEQCQEIIKRRMEKREENFLAIMERAVYRNEKCPYLKLLKLAGCEYGDVKSLVHAKGIEETLKKLRQEGVYLTFEEFKGKKEVVRKGHTFRFKERDFDNPFLSHYYEVQSGGTRSAGTRIMIDFDFLSQKATYEAIILDMHGVRESPLAVWLPILPGSSGINSLLRYTKVEKVPWRWFTMVDDRTINQSLRLKLGMDYILYLGRIWEAK